MSSLPEFRLQVRAQHADAFELHGQVAVLLETALVTPRDHPHAVAIALDMLMVQAYKAHLSVLVLAEHGHTEDAAAITRRLLEIAIQAIYIGGDDDESVRTQRASLYVADLWDNLSASAKAHMPEEIKADWQSIHDSVGPLKSGRSRWGPQFRQMFEYAGLIDTYTKDYALLSGIAHGSSEEQIILYSLPTVNVRPTHHIGMLLVFSSRYYLAVAEMWDRVYGLLDQTVISSLGNRLRNADSRGE